MYKLILINFLIILSLLLGSNVSNSYDNIVEENKDNFTNNFNTKINLDYHYTKGSPHKRIVNSFNLTYDNEPAGRDFLFSEDIIRLSNGSYALLITNQAKGNLYLGLSTDGWLWGNFSQLNSKEETIMRFPQLFELENGSIGVAFVYYLGNYGGVYYRMINSTGRLGAMQPILMLPGPQLNIAANLKIINLANGTQGIILYSGEYLQSYLSMIIAENFPYSWKEPILINPTVFPDNTSFNFIFDVAVTPQDQLVYACRGWNFLTSTSFISVSTMNLSTLEWDTYQSVPFDSLYVDWVSLQLLSNSLISIITDGFDQRMYISYGSAFDKWSYPVPLIENVVSDDVNLDQSKCPLHIELPNGALLVIQTRLEYIYGGYSSYIEGKIIHNHPENEEIPIILAMTPETQLVDNGNSSSTLNWFVWDDDPNEYKISVNNIVVQEGFWMNNTPITLIASNEYFTGDKNITIWVSDKEGNTNSDYWGIHSVSKLPDVFPALIPNSNSLDLILLIGLFLLLLLPLIGGFLLIKRYKQ